MGGREWGWVGLRDGQEGPQGRGCGDFLAAWGLRGCSLNKGTQGTSVPAAVSGRWEQWGGGGRAGRAGEGRSLGTPGPQGVGATWSVTSVSTAPGRHSGLHPSPPCRPALDWAGSGQGRVAGLRRTLKAGDGAWEMEVGPSDGETLAVVVPTVPRGHLSSSFLPRILMATGRWGSVVLCHRRRAWGPERFGGFRVARHSPAVRPGPWCLGRA